MRTSEHLYAPLLLEAVPLFSSVCIYLQLLVVPLVIRVLLCDDATTAFPAVGLSVAFLFSTALRLIFFAATLRADVLVFFATTLRADVRWLVVGPSFGFRGLALGVCGLLLGLLGSHVLFAPEVVVFD